MTPALQAAELRELVKTNNMDGSARRALLAFATRIERSGEDYGLRKGANPMTRTEQQQEVAAKAEAAFLRAYVAAGGEARLLHDLPLTAGIQAAIESTQPAQESEIEHDFDTAKRGAVIARPQGEVVAWLKRNNNGDLISITSEGLQNEPAWIQEIWREAMPLYTRPRSPKAAP